MLLRIVDRMYRQNCTIFNSRQKEANLRDRDKIEIYTEEAVNLPQIQRDI